MREAPWSRASLPSSPPQLRVAQPPPPLLPPPPPPPPSGGAASLESLLFDAGARARLANGALASASGDAAVAARRLLLLASEVRAAARRLRRRIDPLGLLRDGGAAKGNVAGEGEGEINAEQQDEEEEEGEEEESGDAEEGLLSLDPEAPDAMLPASTTVACHMQSDSSDLCVYENLCFDLPSDETAPRTPALVFVRRENAQDSPRKRGREQRERGHGDSAAAANGVAHVWAAERAERAERRRRRSANPASGSAFSTALRNGNGGHGVSAQRRLEDGLERSAEGSAKLDWAFEDVVEEARFGGSPGARARAFPFGTGFDVQHVAPEETVPAALGGDFAGAVTWVDDYYVVSNILNSHLWGVGASVAFPLFGAAHANLSLRLGLPPIRNLIITAPRDYAQEHVDLAWAEGSPYARSDSEAWIMGMLGEALSWIDSFGTRSEVIAESGKLAPEPGRGAVPFVGGEARSRNSEGELQLGKANGAFLRAEAAFGPRLQAALAHCESARGAFALEIGSALLDAADPLSPVLACLARVVGAPLSPGEAAAGPPPFRSLLMRNAREGARLIFTTKDVPDDPIAAAALALARRRLAALGLATPHAGVRHLNRLLLRRPHRVCARRAVVLGSKELLVGGNAEASFVRAFAAERLGAEYMSPAYRFPSAKVLLVDRALDSPSHTSSERYGRYIDNRPELEGILRKYGLNYTLVLDRDLYKMPFVAQAGLFATHGVLVMVHGAGMVNAHFMSPRSAIVELNPYKMWCPIYARGLVAGGHHVFSLHSKLKGRNLDWLYLERPDDAEKRAAVVARESARCEALGKIAASLDSDCWVLLKMASMQVPPAEFEHLLLQALEAVDAPMLPRGGSALALVDGAPSADEAPVAPLAQAEKGFYERRRWKVVRNRS